MSKLIESLGELVNSEISDILKVTCSSGVVSPLESEDQMFFSSSNVIHISTKQFNILVNVFHNYKDRRANESIEEVLNQICGRMKGVLNSIGCEDIVSSMPVSPYPFILTVDERTKKYDKNEMMSFKGDIDYSVGLSCSHRQAPGSSLDLNSILDLDLSDILDKKSPIAL